MYRFVAIVNGQQEIDVLSEGVSGQLIAATGLVTAIIGHFAYIGMALDRSRQRQLEMVSARARDEETLRLGYQIAHLQRQRSLGELSAAALAHELTQPLTAVLTNAQVGQRSIGTTDNGDAAQRELLSKIVHNIKRATEIIDRIRGYIRPSGNRMEKVDLNAVILNVMNLLADEARRHSVTTSFPTPVAAVFVNGDPIGLSQILFNALRNAIEAVANTAQREVTISCVQEEDRVTVRICDSGPGLSDETLACIGTPFFTTKSKGMGAGFLRIADHCRAAQCDAVPGQSRFGPWCHPHPRPAGPCARTAMTAHNTSRRVVITVDDELLAARCARGRVVVIDDDEDVLSALSALIALEGFAVEAYSSATDYLQDVALNLPAFSGPYCVLCDVMTPCNGMVWPCSATLRTMLTCR